MENPDFLKKKYNLHNTPEVESASHRTETRTGEKVPQHPHEQIQNYLERFKEIIDRNDPEERERGMEALKEVLYKNFVIKPEEIPEAYFENQRRIAREQGHGDVEIPDEQKEQLAEVLITDQKSSLDMWVDYLASSDATYPDWLKYFAFRSITQMGEYDKEKKQFTKRSKGTVKPFPDLNREALAYVLDSVEKKIKKDTTDISKLTEEERREFAEFLHNLTRLDGAEQVEFQKLLDSENFAKLYAFAIDKCTPASQEQKETVDGKWVKYSRGSDATPLVESLQGHGTGWCTAGESTARAQLNAGDFYVFYSLDKDGNPTIPRAAIRMQENSIAEVRGIAKEQNLDLFIAPIVQEKLNEFPDGARYEKKAGDMKKLTAIEKKIESNELLTKDDLVFLYEIDNKIEGFGYQKDPRITEILNKRDPKEDAPIVFDCTPSQIATAQNEITENTKAYIGPLFPGIFKKNIEHLYTSFPEGKVKTFETKIDGKTKEELEKELKEKNITVGDYAQQLLDSDDFKDSVKLSKNNIEDIDLVRLTVGDLGFSNGATMDEIYKRAEDFGLELCPPEVGPQLRLSYSGDEYLNIGMKQIAGRGGDPCVFGLDGDAGGLWLGTRFAEPARRWRADCGFVFRTRKDA